MGRVDRLIDVGRAVDRGHRGVCGLDLLGAAHVDAEREAAKAVGPGPELPLVVLDAVEPEHVAVRQLEDPVCGLARRGLGPAERAEELRHPLDVTASEREEFSCGGTIGVPRKTEPDRAPAASPRDCMIQPDPRVDIRATRSIAQPRLLEPRCKAGDQ